MDDYREDDEENTRPRGDRYREMLQQDILSSVKPKVAAGDAENTKSNSLGGVVDAVKDKLSGGGGGAASGAAKAGAKGAETAASKAVPVVGAGVQAANQVEKISEQTQGIKNSVTGNKDAGGQKSGGRGLLGGKIKIPKGAAPIILIIVLVIAGVWLLSAGAESLYPFHYEANLKESHNVLNTSQYERSDELLSRQLEDDNGTIHDADTPYDTGKFALTDEQKNALSDQAGIEVTTIEVNGEEVEAMIYHDDNGEEYAVVPDGVTATSSDMQIASVDGKEVAVEVIKEAEQKKAEVLLALNNSGHNAQGVHSVAEALNNSAFKQKYNDGSLLWRGQIAGWRSTDSTKQAVNSRLGISLGSIFSGYESTGDYEKDRENYETIMESEIDEGSTEEKVKVADTLMDKAEEAANGISGGSAGNSNSCKVAAAFQAVENQVAAAERFKGALVASAQMEATDKVKAGDGDGSPLNIIMTDMFRSDSNGQAAASSPAMLELLNGVPANQSDQSMLESSIETNAVALVEDGSWDKTTFNECSFATGQKKGFWRRVKGFFSSGLSKVASLIKSIFTTAASKAEVNVTSGVVQTVLTPMTENAATILQKEYVKNYTGASRGDTVANSSVDVMNMVANGGGITQLSAASNAAFKQKQQEVIANWAEYERQNKSPLDLTSPNTFLGSIAAAVMPVTLSARGSSASAVSSVVSGTSNVVAKSLTNLLPGSEVIAATLDSEGDCPLINSTGSVGNSSCVAAYGTDVSTIADNPLTVLNKVLEMHIDYNHYIMEGEGVGPLNPAEGNACVTEWETKPDGTTVPVEWTYYAYTNFKYKGYINGWADGASSNKVTSRGQGEQVVNDRNPSECYLDVDDSSGNPVPNMNSYLGMYILFATQRTSALGTMDENIRERITQIYLNHGAVNPNASSSASCDGSNNNSNDDNCTALSDDQIAWISGSAYTASSGGNPATGDTQWETENKYYQRYMEDQRWLETVGMVNKSAAQVALSDYYVENPLDNSYEGILARYSGRTKEQVLAVIDFVNYYNYLAQYDPEQLGPVEFVAASEQNLLAKWVQVLFGGLDGSVSPVILDSRRQSLVAQHRAVELMLG